MMSPCVDSLAWSECGCECGGLAAAEEKKKDDPTEGSEDTDSDGLSGGEGSALDRGDDGCEALAAELT